MEAAAAVRTALFLYNKSNMGFSKFQIRDYFVFEGMATIVKTGKMYMLERSQHITATTLGSISRSFFKLTTQFKYSNTAVGGLEALGTKYVKKINALLYKLLLP